MEQRIDKGVPEVNFHELHMEVFCQIQKRERERERERKEASNKKTHLNQKTLPRKKIDATLLEEAVFFR